MSIDINNLYKQIDDLVAQLEAREEDLKKAQREIHELKRQAENKELPERFRVAKVILTGPRMANQTLLVHNATLTPAGWVLWVRK